MLDCADLPFLSVPLALSIAAFTALFSARDSFSADNVVNLLV